MAKKRLLKILPNKKYLLLIAVFLVTSALTVGVLFYKSQTSTVAVSNNKGLNDSKAKTPTKTTSKVASVDDKSAQPSTEKGSTATKPATTKPANSSQKPGQDQLDFTPTPIAHNAFTITSMYLQQPSVTCSGDGTYYVVYIGDVVIALDNTTGGTITYGYETTSDIINPWGSYRQSATVDKNISYTSFNKLYYGQSTDPHMAYTQIIYAGHGAGSIRAAVYAPQLIYSTWVNVPAQQNGEKCA